MTTAGVPDRERRPCIATQRVGLFGCGRLGRRGADATATRLGRLAFLTCDRLGGGAQRRREAISVECRRLFGGRRSLLSRLAGATAARRGVLLAGRNGHIGLRGNDLFGLLLLDIGRTVVALSLAARAIVTLTIFTGTIFTGTIFTGTIFTGTIVALLRTLVAEALATPATLGLAGARLLLGADRIALVAEIVAVVELIEVVALAAHRLLVVRPAALVREDTEIMIRELQIIFGVHPIALTLRVRRHVLVLLVQLAGVAARAAVDAIAVVTLSLAAATLRPLPTTAATATVLTVVDQITVLVLKPKPAMLPGSSVQHSPAR